MAVALHGGFWRAHYSRKLMWPVCADLVARGWAAWNLEYRRLGFGSGGGWPATFDDVRAGVAWLRRIDAPLDLRRVVAVGHSAGGHLAAWVASQGVGVQAAVAQAGVVDLALAWELGLSDGVVGRLMGGAPSDAPDRYAAASPAALVPLGVPLLCVHGALDDVVPPEVSESFVRHAQVGGRQCRAAALRGRGPHGPHRPGEPDVAGRRRVDRAVADRLRREAAAALDDADPLAGFRRALRHRRRGPPLPRRQLARAPSGRHPRPAGGA